MSKTRVALFGAGFIADIHAESYHRFVPDAELVAVYSRTEHRARAFASKHGIARWSTNLEDSLSRTDYDVADICLPNHLHAQATIAAASSGKHVIIEKPLCLTLDEADAMIAACRTNNRKLMYAEELCFAPKYERVRQLVQEGAVGSILLPASVREALGTAQRLVLRRQSVRRRRADGYGMSRIRLVPLDARRLTQGR